jgi:hypothetical protein
MVSTVRWSRIGRASRATLGSPVFHESFYGPYIYDSLSVLLTEQYVEPAPDMIARVARIY